MKYLFRIATLILTIGFAISCNQQHKKVDYLVTFAKAYGYVKYFHPSDEANAIDWNQFAVYGAGEINKCKSREDLIETLNELFKPIAPTIVFTDENYVTDFDFNLLRPENSDDYCLTYWQHQGVSFGMVEFPYPNSPYESRRAIMNCDSINSQLFDFNPNIEDILSISIGSGLHCQMPMVLYRNSKGTFPKADAKLLNELKSKIIYSSNSPNNLPVRLGNLVNTYNVFQHFYPYFDVVAVNWELELRKALKRSFSDKDGKAHLITLQKFTAPLNDGHLSVNSKYNHSFIPQIAWEWIEGSLVITKVLNNKITLQVGDVITHINGINAQKYFDEVKSRISAAKVGWLYHKAEANSLLGPENTVISVRVNGKNIDLTRDLNFYHSMHLFKDNLKEYDILEDGIFYLNLELISIDVINELLPRLETCKAIILDLRGYPTHSSFELIPHLMQINDTATGWIQTPLVVFPNQERIVGYDKFDYKVYVKAKKPFLGDKRIIVLTNGQAISASETFLAYIEGYKLATIIGQPTAGTNGVYNNFDISGDYRIFFTGMKVLKHNGSQHHSIGILPDIYVEKTIKGVKEGRDEFLEKAIEVANQKFNVK